MLTSQSDLNLYEGSVGKGCQFLFRFRIIRPTGSDVNDVTTSDLGTLNCFQDLSEGRIQYLGYTLNLTTTSVSFNVQTLNSITNHEDSFQILLSCSTIPINQVSIAPLLNGTIHYSSSTLTYFSGFRITGLQKKISLNIEYTLESLTNQMSLLGSLIQDNTGSFNVYAKIDFNPIPPYFNLYQPINVKITFYGKAFQIQFKPYFLLGKDPTPNVTFSTTTGSFSSSFVELSAENVTFDSIRYSSATTFYNKLVMGNPKSATIIGRNLINRIIGTSPFISTVSLSHFDQDVQFKFLNYQTLPTCILNYVSDVSNKQSFCYPSSLSLILEDISYKYMFVSNSIWEPNLEPFKPAPYGHQNGNLQQFDYGIESLVSKYRYNGYFSINKVDLDTCTFTSSSDNNKPSIENVEVRRVSPTSSKWRVRISFEDLESGLAFIYYSFASKNIIIADQTNIISGDNKVGTIEFQLDSSKLEILALNSLTLADNSGQRVDYSYEDTYLNSKWISEGNFTYFKFQYQNIVFNEPVTATNVPKPFKNTLYFNLTSRNDEIPLSLGFTDQLYVSITNFFPSFWDDGIQMYRIDFEIPYNYFSQELSYLLINPTPFKGSYIIDYANIVTFIGLDAILKIEATNADQLPPLITDIITQTSIDGNIITATFSLTIEDQVNGFDYGIVKITSNFDSIGYTFNINSKGLTDPFSMTFLLIITLSADKCRNQVFGISYVELYDRMGRKGIYDSMATIDIGIHPMYKVLHLDSIYAEVTICTAPVDITIPYILSLSYSSSSNNPNIEVTFNIQDTDNGFDAARLPICYLSTTFDREIQVNSICALNGKVGNCKCSFELPYMFGYPDGMLLHIYNIMDTYLNFNGYSHNQLLIFDANLADSIPPKNILSPYIKNIIPYYNNQKYLTVQGVNFNGSSLNILQENTNQILDVVNTIWEHNETIFIVGLAIQFNVPFKVVVSPNFPNERSNIVLVTPLDPPTTPQPSPSPVQCLNNCGTPEQGSCTSTGCVCYQPWFGDDCRSKVINTTTPQTNTTAPSTGQEYEEELPTGEKVNLSTLISVVGFRELDINGKIIREETFKDWVYTNISTNNETKYHYSTEILTSLGEGLPNYITTIQVTTQWFESNELITFAGETFNINPSTMKYSVSMSSYKFKSQLSKIQLIFSASIQSNNNNDNDEICSSKQFKESDNTEIESEYIKLSLNTHSLFGRFIKRAIIDDRVTIIDNQLLNQSDSNIVPEKSESLIAINIPNYDKSVILDPDFSLLVNPSSNKDDNDSLCSSSKSKGLTKSQLIGIIIGSFCGFLIIAIITGFFIYKKGRYSTCYLNIKDKMNKNKEIKMEKRKRSIAPVFFGGKVQEVDKF